MKGIRQEVQQRRGDQDTGGKRGDQVELVPPVQGDQSTEQRRDKCCDGKDKGCHSAVITREARFRGFGALPWGPS